ncbi:pyridoxal-phosphate dependent enzyme [Flavobacterium enshiense]|uniref:1-aminocyclopropane-1-carboxylate deaminase/D-cysteine desulfhydrase n=1 Tax=Flavobacterium enshiense TaxID=1341165 RepID=UPI00345CF6DE
MESRNECVNLELLINDVQLFMKREDLLHPLVSGNKFRKLKYNLIEAKEKGLDTLLTFGGAFSNHIAATAAAGKLSGFKTIGVIRGEELALKVLDNPTLSFAVSQGMQLHFVSRSAYGAKESEVFLEELERLFGAFYLLPEGGSNELAVKGCEEILTEQDREFDFVCCAAGTGATASGIINASGSKQKVLVFPALKGSFLSDDICKFAKKDNWELIEAYHFGGYGKINDELVRFLNAFYRETSIPLDPVYTGKMMCGIVDLAEKGYFPSGSRILAIHTGGLQGIAGMNKLLMKKNRPIINY